MFGALKSVASILTMLVAIAVLGGAAFLWTSCQRTQNLAVKEQAKAGAATVAAGQAQAETAATKIIVAGQARDAVDLTIHQENAHAIAAAPGADAPLDPRLVAALRGGLCRTEAYAADPQCARLRAADPAQLPQAGAADPAAGR